VLCLRTLRELRLLKFFSDVCPHKNIIALVDLIKPVTRESFSEVYFVQEFMETDLHFVIQTQSLTEGHHQYLVCQILSAVKWMHNAGIYRDLKPSNILVRFFAGGAQMTFRPLVRILGNIFRREHLRNLW
ncbi:kinase-like domain-containing protein, partial [Mycena olivaceomarginata]